MNRLLFPFLILFILIAVAFQEPAVTTLAYLLAGMVLFGRLWATRSARNLRIRRRFETHAYLGETVTVGLQVENAGWLPVVWLHLQESLPVELTVPHTFQRAFSLGSRETWQGEYELQAGKRGYYRVGPAQMETGDLFGLVAPLLTWKETDHLTVFPNIVPMPRFSLPSASPMGTLKSLHPVYEDPTRATGKRDYQPGNSMRRIDWKATAGSGRLQVKLFEPSQSLETVVILGLHPEEYHPRDREDAVELAVVAAASIANWVTRHRQSAGLATNGFDPLEPDARMHTVGPRKGRAHLLRILELLARIRSAPGTAPEEMLRDQTAKLPWGTTIALITGIPTDPLLTALAQIRRRGHRPALFITSPRQRYATFRRRAQQFGIPMFEIRSESDLSALEL